MHAVMTNHFETIAVNKQLCTGVSLDYQHAPNLNPTCNNEADFNDLVTEYYKLFRERLRADISFLRAAKDHRDIGDFDNTVYLLRTASQHDDNLRAEDFYRRWINDHRPWQCAAQALADACRKAIEQLGAASSFVRRDQRLASRWKDHASIEPEAIFAAVCSDLRVSFGRGHRDRLVRNVRARINRVRQVEDIRTITEEICAQEITSQDRSLPVPYFDVLDRLGLIGKQDARAALLVAYSVEAATQLTGEEFLFRVEETWKVAHA